MPVQLDQVYVRCICNYLKARGSTPTIAVALARGHTIDITTTGPSTSRPPVGARQDVETMTQHSPLIEVTIDGLGAATAA